jgi:hypothetical protein
MRCTFVRMNDNKRKNRGYKATDKDYKKAQKQAKRMGEPLATTIEGWIKAYGDGFFVSFAPTKPFIEKIKL